MSSSPPAAIAAAPVLASSLLDASLSNTTSRASSRWQAEDAPVWDLTGELERGFVFEEHVNGDDDDDDDDAQSAPVFMGGRAVGISWLRSTTATEETDLRLSMRELTLHFLITHLLQSDGDGGGNGKHVSAFVVQYYASRPISLMEDVFPSLQEHRPHAAPSSIEEVVQRVQTYRALDYNGMSEAVARISAVLAELHAPQGTPSANYENVRSEHHHQPILLIIDGLDQSLSDLSRTTGSVLTAQARTVRLLRELSSLSRRYPRSLAILVLSALGLPHITAPVDNGSFVNPFPPVTSAFGPPPAPWGQGQSHGQDHQNRGEGLARKNPYVSPLARTFDQVLFDAHLLVSKVGDGIAVEVVKDRLGDGKGRWCGL